MIRYGKAALLLGLVLAASVQACGPAPAYDAPQVGMAPLVGQWERKEGKETITLTFTADGRMHVGIPADGFKLHADCQVTRDGIVYGIITSAEMNEDDEDTEDAELADQVFGFRCRVDEGVLILRDFTSSSKGLGEEKFWEGRFKRVTPPPPVYAPPMVPQYGCPAPPTSSPPAPPAPGQTPVRS